MTRKESVAGNSVQRNKRHKWWCGYDFEFNREKVFYTRVRKTKLKFLLHDHIASRWVFLPGASNSAPGFSAKRAPYFELVRTTTMAAESRTTTWPRERLAERLATMNKPSVDHVRAVINALYDESNPTGKEKASEWLQELQRSVSMHAKFEIWSLSFDTLDQNFRSFFVRFPFSLI